MLGKTIICRLSVYGIYTYLTLTILCGTKRLFKSTLSWLSVVLLDVNGLQHIKLFNDNCFCPKYQHLDTRRCLKSQANI